MSVVHDVRISKYLHIALPHYKYSSPLSPNSQNYSSNKKEKSCLDITDYKKKS